jgi:hypothetical protein
VTTDSASNNDTFLQALEITCKNSDIPFDARKNHVRCIAHVMNRVVGDILKGVKMGAFQDEEELLEEEEKEEATIDEVASKVC